MTDTIGFDTLRGLIGGEIRHRDGDEESGSVVRETLAAMDKEELELCAVSLAGSVASLCAFIARSRTRHGNPITAAEVLEHVLRDNP